MLIQVVDEEDVQIGVREREELTTHDTYRASALWLSNAKGEVLIAQRALTKKFAPGRWGCSVAGTLEEGETYESNILKETGEEIGLLITSDDLRVGPKLLIQAQHNHFVQFFFATTDQEIVTIDPIEVMAVKWISVADLIKDAAVNPDLYSVSLKECVFLLEKEL